MRFQVIGKRVQRGIHLRFIGEIGSESGGFCADPVEKGAAKRVFAKETMQITPIARPSAETAPSGVPVAIEKRPRPVRPVALADMDLIAADRRIGIAMWRARIGLTCLSGRITVSMARWPRPGLAPAGPSMPSGSAMLRPSI